MGEEDLEVKAGPNGYEIELKNNSIVTVGDVWRLADYGDKEDRVEQDSMLKRLCLSFALYKLMRRRFEDLPPITDDETCNCRSLIFKGLRKQLLEEAEAALSSSTAGSHQEDELLHLDVERKEDQKGTVVAVALFQVFDEEIQFLCEYYHSVLPVVLSNPFFFFTNYILFPILVLAFCLLTFVLCGNGDVVYAYQSITNDNYIISTGTMKLAVCLLKRITKYPEALFSIVDLAITMLLLLTFLYEELWEYLVFILSNWLMVSLLCKYTAAKRHWSEPHDSRSISFLSRLIRSILWVRSKMSRRNLYFKQFSMLGFAGGRSYACMMMRPNTNTTVVPMEVKKSIMEYLMDAHTASASRPLSNGWSTLQLEKHDHRLNNSASRLSSQCESKSVAEVIITWHVATSILEFKCPMPTGGRARRHGHRHRNVAAALSGYCAYLVALYPELLPDNKDGTSRVYNEMQQELKKELGGCLRYRMSSPGARYNKLLSETANKEINSSSVATAAAMVQKAAKLGKTLVEMAKQEEDHVWELLADLWTELMVYVAPSGGELHMKAHKEALAHGGEFITVLWALCTHTGITRPAIAPWEAARRNLEP